MKPKILTTESFNELLTTLLESCRVMGPKEEDGVYRCAWLKDAAEFAMPDDGLPRVSFKQAVLPRTEVLFYYRRDRDSEETVPPPAAQPQILLGVHPCDVRAIEVLDAVFLAEPFPEELYRRRREATTIIGFGVPPERTATPAFFEDMGISSLDNSGTDLFLVPLADGRLLLETVNSKGQTLVAEFAADLPDAGDTERAELESMRAAARARVSNAMDSEALRDKLATMFDSSLWDELGEKCVACGACTYLCPTCHCFDIQDEERGQYGCRVRNWDTCQFEQFTRHASGHNPRDSQSGRARQRILHKFEYGLTNFQLPFCVGCGRCIQACPVHNDLRQMLKRIEDYTPES